MKKNLSSKAIKAMAIGMAVTLGSTTAMSGVIGNGVVTVKAAETAKVEKINDEEAPSGISNDSTAVDSSTHKYLVTNSGLVFEVTNPGTGNASSADNATAGSAKLTKRIDITSITNADGTDTKPFGASLKDGVLTVKTDNYYKLNITEIGDGTNPIAEDLSDVNVSNLISNNLTKIADKAFKETTISENLTINTTNFTSLSIGKEMLYGTTINGNLTIINDSSHQITPPGAGAKIFKNLTVNGNLDLSKLKITGVSNLSDLGLGSLENEVESGDGGVTVTGELSLPTDITVDNASLKNIVVGTLDLSKVTTMNADTLPEGLLHNSKVDNLVIPESVTIIGQNAFKGTTLTKFDFSKITSVQRNVFDGATINGNLNFSKTPDLIIAKSAFSNANINGNLDLSGAKFNKMVVEGVLSGATITGDLNLSNVDMSTMSANVAVFGGVTVNGNIDLTGVKEILANTFKGAKLPNNIELTDVTNIGTNAFDLVNDGTVTISLPSYTNDNLANIDTNAFGTTSKINLVLPFGTSNEDVKALKDKIANQNVTVTVEQVEVNGYVFESTKDKEVTLVDYTAPVASKQSDTAEISFNDGILNYNSTPYTLTKVGNGTDSLTTITDSALAGHTSKVTEVAASAFENNKNITVANFPNVTTIGNKAFAGTGVKTADLGSQTAGAITVASDAFSGVSTLKSINTNSQSKEAVKTAISNSSSTNITLNAGGSTEVVKPDNNGGSSSGGGSSSSNGNKFTGSGANIGNTSNNTTENNSSNSNNNNNNPSEVIENKTLTLASIKLPSVTGEAKVFSDVSANHWAKSYIDKLSTAGVINGSNGMFNPNGQTKRADATIMLVNLLGLQPEANNRFTDVNSTAYYAPYVGTASTYGIVNGSNGMFNPEGIISRQDTMVMISQILKSLDLNVNADTSVLNQFSDVNSISSYATESVSVLVNSGIISGNNGKLNPTSPVTRAEMATIMSKLYDVLEIGRAHV